MQSPSTTLCNRAYCSVSAGTARLIFNATLSDFQYANADVPTAIANAITMPTTPYASR
jgi:hypothetical protein